MISEEEMKQAAAEDTRVNAGVDEERSFVNGVKWALEQMAVRGQMPAVSIGLKLPAPAKPIEDQLKARSLDGKCALIQWNQDGTVGTWVSGTLNYYEKLFLIDSFRRRFDLELQEREDD